MYRYIAVVFRFLPTTADFTQAAEEVLPGIHSAADAWAAVVRALRSDHRLIGGTIRLCGN